MIPEELYQLRWRLVSKRGVFVISSWTPEARYPSMSEILEEFKDDICDVTIEGKNKQNGNIKQILTCHGKSFKNFSYKVMVEDSGKTHIVGIEIESVTGKKTIAMRDGSVFQEHTR